MYGNRIVGYFASIEGTAVIVRYSPNGVPTQAFVGKVSPDGSRWTGNFYGLDVGPSGATNSQNAWGFVATRGYNSIPPAPPSPPVNPAGPTVSSVWPSGLYAINANGSRGSLNFDDPPSKPPSFNQSSVFNDPLIGTFAVKPNTLAFLRLSKGEPAQVFIGSSDGRTLSNRFLSGTFYPVSEGFGAGPDQLTYDWAAWIPIGCQ
jgi:hypothetical protein